MLSASFGLVSELKKQYKAPKNKLLSLEKQGQILRVVKGLYETDKSASPLLLSSAIYGPSYISFETALSYWGWIPERVTAITAATFGKNRTKRFDSSYGTFLYRDIPKAAFPYEVYIKTEGSRSFLIAGKEKCLCDTLWRESSLGSEKRLKEYLFENLRIEEDAFYSADFSIIFDLCDLYNSANLRILKKMAHKKMGEKNDDTSSAND